MHRETFIEKLTEVQQTVGQLLAQLQASEHDKFAAHLYRSRREYRSVCQRAGKSAKQIERCVISSFQIAESMGFKGPCHGSKQSREALCKSFKRAILGRNTKERQETQKT